MLLLIALVVLLSLPSVQTYVAKQVTKSLNKSYGTDINIDRLGLNRKGQLDVRGVYIADHHQDTLIYAGKLNTTILSFKSLVKGNLFFNHLDLENAKVYIKTYKGETTDNLTIFTDKFKPEETSESSEPFLLSANTLFLAGADIKIIDENEENPVLVSFKNLSLDAKKFKVNDADVFGDIGNLNFIFNDSIAVKEMKAQFSYTYESVKLENLLLKTEESYIDANLVLHLNEGSFSEFNDKVIFEAEFKEAVIATNDLNMFYNEFGKDQTIELTGNMLGPLNDFKLTELTLKNQDTRIEGNLTFQNLLNETEDYKIIAENHQISSNYYDLRRFMPTILGENLPKELEQMGRFSFAGNTVLDGENLTTAGIIRSALGHINANVAINNFSDTNKATYKGVLGVTDFDLSKMVGTSSLGKVTADFNFDGKGFSQNALNTTLDGKASSFYFNGYTYTNVVVNGAMQNNVFNGEAKINDPNLRLDFDGLIDVNQQENIYNFYAEIDYAELNKLNLFKRDSISVFTGVIAMDMKGRDADDVAGTVRISQATYQNAEEDYYFDDIFVVSSFEEDIRTIEVISPDIVSGRMSGRYELGELPDLFQNSLASIYTNYEPRTVTDNQFLNFNFEIHNKILEIFLPDLKLAENTTVRGAVASDESNFKLNFRSPDITAYGNYFEKVNIQVDNNNPLFNTYIEIDSINMGFYAAKNFNLINVTMKDTLFIRSEFKGGKNNMNDEFNLSLYHTINQSGKSVVGFKKSDFTLKDYQWFINEKNDTLSKVVFDNNFKEIILEPLIISHQNEQILAALQLIDTSYKDVKLQFTDVDLGKLTPAIDSIEIKGNINGNFSLLQQNNLYYPNSDVTIDSLKINDDLLGDLVLSFDGNEDLTSYNINTTLTNEGLKSLSAVGKIDVADNNPTIDLNVDLDNFNLEIVSPFGGEDFTDIRGYLSGKAKVIGNYKSPDINGRLALNQAGMRIPELNVDVTFDDQTEIFLSKNKFTIPSTEITDTKYKTVSEVSGYFEHTNFGNWRMNLDFDTNRFLVLDTEGDEESLYYGTAFIEGTASIYGPIDELVIKAEATTAKGTSFKIPISDVQSIGDDSFIYFISPEEKEAKLLGQTIKKTELKGLTLQFDLEITPDALVEVVVDIKNNSSLRGRGEGLLYIDISTATGRFNMWGDFHVHQATYDFRYAGLVQKGFSVERGSYLSWNGEPERAVMDIKAFYNTTANPSVLLDNPTVNRKIDVGVGIVMNGELSAPEIDYEITFPNVSSIVKSELDYKLADRQQRERQALYLVTTGGFYGDSFSSQQGTDVLVERATGIINDIFTDEDSKLKVGVNYSQGNDEMATSDEVGLSLSTQLSERILFNGKVGVPVGDSGDNKVAGNFEIQVLLNSDGSLKWNVFSREAKIQFIGEDQGFEHGTGLSYSVEFNTFKELTQRLFGKKTEEEADKTEDEKPKLLAPLKEDDED